MPISALKLSVQRDLTLPKRTNLPAVVVYASDDGKVLGGLTHETAMRAETLIARTKFGGGLGESVSDWALADKKIAPVIIIGVGSLEKLAANISKVAAATHTAIKGVASAIVAWGDVICQRHFTQFVIALLGAAYRFDKYKSKPAAADALKNITFVNSRDADSDYKAALGFATATAEGMATARDVANDVPNQLTPSKLAKKAKELAKEFATISVSVLDEKEMQKLGMGCFLAVTQGSDQAGKLAVIEYRGKSKKGKLQNPVALVGKGLTFDSGGISLKPAAGMEEMKFDMGGAAAMLGAVRAAALANLEIDIVAVLACAENMPSGKATRPSDIVTAMNGMSVEVLNTDAEGRLVLCDTLCYVQENYNARVIIDAATLTGACVIALGSHRSAVYSNDEDTLFALEEAGEYINDLVWHMPLDEAYNEQLNSKIADMQNIGGREAGSVTAACFLQRFIKPEQAWAHLDIAGTAWKGGGTASASGRPVALLMQYLKNQQ